MNSHIFRIMRKSERLTQNGDVSNAFHFVSNAKYFALLHVYFRIFKFPTIMPHWTKCESEHVLNVKVPFCFPFVCNMFHSKDICTSMSLFKHPKIGLLVSHSVG